MNSSVFIFDIVGYNPQNFNSNGPTDGVILQSLLRGNSIGTTLVNSQDYRNGILAKKLRQEQPQVVVLCMNDERILMAKVQLKDYNSYCLTLFNAVKKDAPQAKIIVWDTMQYLQFYLEMGADFFIYSSDTDEYNLASEAILKALKDDTKWLERNSLIISRKQFYDIAGFELKERAEVTSNTTKEIAFLQDLIKKWNSQIILDGGCGYGRIIIPLAKREKKRTFHGIDINQTFIQQAKTLIEKEKISNAHVKKDSLLETTFQPNTFDLIYLFWHTICEFTDKKAQHTVLAEMQRIIKKKGVLAFDFPDLSGNIEISEEGTYSTKVNGFLKYVGLVPQLQQIIRSLKELGFQEKNIHYHKVNWGIKKFVITAIKI